MVINVIVQYNGGFISYILLLTQAPIFVWFNGTIVVCYYPLNYVRTTTVVSSVLLCSVALDGIHISVQYDGGLVPDNIMSAQGCYHREPV